MGSIHLFLISLLNLVTDEDIGAKGAASSVGLGHEVQDRPLEARTPDQKSKKEEKGK